VSVVLDGEEDGKGADPLLLWLAARVWKLVRWGVGGWEEAGEERRLAMENNYSRHRGRCTSHHAHASPTLDDIWACARDCVRVFLQFVCAAGHGPALCCGAVVLSEGVTCAGAFPRRRAPA
jgi:hypothetical protein